MPHDVNGNLLRVGDKVNVPCVVESIAVTEEYCNATLKTVHLMPPNNTSSFICSVNTKQVELISRLYVDAAGVDIQLSERKNELTEKEI